MFKLHRPADRLPAADLLQTLLDVLTLIDELTQLKKQLASLKPATTVPVMRELAAGKERKTNIQMRGNYLDKGKEVSPGLPAVFHPPKDTRKKDRLTLAKW